jgi:hypothetical protein
LVAEATTKRGGCFLAAREREKDWRGGLRETPWKEE